MPIAAIAALALASAAPSAPVNRSMPPIVIDVSAVPEVSAALLATILAETDALYRSAGVRFAWRRDASPHAMLHVFISNETGPPRHGTTPLGWLEFEQDVPAHDVHVSYANAVQFMSDAREVIGAVSEKTIAERDGLLGRALGRALAHELGHYLLATKEHSPKGLLKGARTAREFFAVDRSALAIPLVERGQIVARLSRESEVARRN
jgi:hypothetical protein